MKPLAGEEIYGNWATLLMPVNDDESIDLSKLKEEIDILISMEVNGIYSNGTAGEFYNQTEDEFDAINLLFAEKCNASGMPFQIGCSHVNPVMCLDRVKRAVQMEPGAIQVTLPDWIACDLTEAINFLEKVALYAKQVGIVLYNPSHARKVLIPEEILMVKNRVNSIVGCKVAWKNDQWITSLSKEATDFSVFVPGHQLATGMTLGASGSYSNVACLNPLAAQKWFALMGPSIGDALELESRIQVFMTKFIVPYISEKNYSNTAADKFLAAVGGWSPITPRVRWPYKSIPESEAAVVRPYCKNLLPEFFDL